MGELLVGSVVDGASVVLEAVLGPEGRVLSTPRYSSNQRLKQWSYLCLSGVHSGSIEAMRPRPVVAVSEDGGGEGPVAAVITGC